MKLRISEQMFRFRLNPRDVAELNKHGSLRSVTRLPGGEGFNLVLELSFNERVTHVHLRGEVLSVQIKGDPFRARLNDEVIFDETLKIGESDCLRILVEQDLVCRSHT